MSLATAAEVIEDLAHGRRPTSYQLHKAAIGLRDLYWTRAGCSSISSNEIIDAIGLVNHALNGALPRLNRAGRARSFLLAAAVRRAVPEDGSPAKRSSEQ